METIKYDSQNIDKYDYPIITIPGVVISKKRNYKVVKYSGHYGIGLGIKKSILRNIIRIMKDCWGLPTIEHPVQIKFLFHIPSFPPNNDVDHDNAKQLYLDLLQADKIKIHRTGRKKGLPYLASEGAGIIRDDKIVQSTDGTRFVFLCHTCQYGLTGKRRSFTKNKKKHGCPGPTKCPHRRIEIEISDMILNENGVYEMATHS